MIGIVGHQLFKRWVYCPVQKVFDQLRMVLTNLESDPKVG